MAAAEVDQLCAHVLSEDELKRVSRHVKDHVPQANASDEEIGCLKCTLRDVFSTASIGNLTATHRVAAWNTLCALIDQCIAADSESISNIFWNDDYWWRSFDLYLTQASFARPKSSKQLLGTLTAALQKAESRSDPRASQLKARAVEALAEALNQSDDPARAKTSALALGHFLKQDVISLDDLLQSIDGITTEEPVQPGSRVERLLSVLFRWMNVGDFGSTIGTLVSVVLDKATDIREHSVVPLWTAPLRDAFGEREVDAASLRVHLLPKLFQRSAPDYFAFLNSINVASLDSSMISYNSVSNHDELLSASLQAGKDLSLVFEVDGGLLRVEQEVLLLPVRCIRRLLRRTSADARLSGLSLLISSPSTTKPMLFASFQALRRNLHHLFGDIDANFRGEVAGLMQKLIERIRAITAVLSRQASKHEQREPKEDQHPDIVLSYHKDFLEWLSRFLSWELRPTANYQHHISALKCISILARSGLDNEVLTSNLSKSALGESKWAFNMLILTGDLERLLLDLVVNPFDDVRQMAAAVLALFPRGRASYAIEPALGRAETMMQTTGRADQADGVSHFYTLLYEQTTSQDQVLSNLMDRLRTTLERAKVNLAEAVAAYPAHGLLSAVRRLVEKDSTIIAGHECPQQLAACLRDIWSIAKPILCNDAPEGYLPEDMEDAGDVSTKDALSYCWRALKEASLLLGTLVSRLDAQQEATLSELCDLCFTQLAELRHRGAFSTVAQSWMSCCLRARESSAANEESMLQCYYNRATAILSTHTTINTRRSAGLPSLLCGILVADASGQILSQAFTELEAVAREPVDPTLTQEGSLPQVHAMNCMKDILKNSRLGEASESYVSIALRLAADALRADAWAVRNCGLMLFRAIIDRLLGTSEAYLEDDLHVRKRLTTEQHPRLLGIVLGLLQEAVTHSGEVGLGQASSEGVFPALQLLQRLQIPANHTDEVREYLRMLMGSKLWHIRDKAARMYASLVVETGALPELRALLQTPPIGQNAMHGLLLCAKYVCWTITSHQERFASEEKADQSATSLGTLTQAVRMLARARTPCYDESCSINKAAFLDIHVEIATASLPSRHRHSTTSAQRELEAPDGELLDPFVELQSLDWHGCTSAAIRAALCRALACQLFDISSICFCGLNGRQITIGLAGRDTDALMAFLDQASTLLRAVDVSQRWNSLQQLTSICQDVVLSRSSDTRLQCAALETLLTIASMLQHAPEGDDTFDALVQMFSRNPVLPQDQGNESHANLVLRLQGACIERATQFSSADGKFILVIHDWAEVCGSAVQADSMQSREAAARAIHQLDQAWGLINTTEKLSQTFLRLCLTVYDLLNDDDEDIRLLASSVAARVLSTTCECHRGLNLVPVVASLKIVAFMLSRWSANNTFVEAVFARAFGMGKGSYTSISEQSRACNASNTSLFIEEKQNLYIDEAREARAWSQAALPLPVSKALVRAARRLGLWVEEGLGMISAQLATLSDGPLGWTTKSELFTLGLRIIYGAAVLLHCARRGVKIPVRPSALRLQLAKVISVDEVLNINCLWRDEILRILVTSVQHQLKHVHALMGHVSHNAALS